MDRELCEPRLPSEKSESVKILLVDDTPENLTALEAMLDGPDRVLVKVASGAAALKYLMDHDVALILLDVRMPDMDGHETAALIRQRERTRSVPILFLTAHEQGEADFDRGYSSGAVDYLTKPLSPQVLQSKVNCFVELAKKTEALKRKNEELERAEKELLLTRAAAALVRHAPDPLFVTDLHGKILQANDAACRLLGFERDDLVDQWVTRFLTNTEIEQFRGVLKEVVEHGTRRNVLLHPRALSGDVIPTILNASALRDPHHDGVIGAIGTLRDVRAYEQVLQDLEQSKAALLEKVADLEKFEEVVVGRELKMISMEKEIARLQSELARLQR